MGENGILASFFGCCCGASGMGEELYKDWESHPACQQYDITKRLGEGGFSEVHLAHDKVTGKTVALKVVFLNKGGLTKDQKKILAGEARLVRMVAHPSIVRCMQVLETRRQQVLVLEYLSGGELLKQLQRMKRYSEANACQMFKQVVDAVAYLHSLGILHRDIKPENCLLAKPASHYATKNKPVKVKLIDLGMAGLYRPNKPVHGCMGSPGFIAPEIILGEPHTPAMDVYSLGVLLFVMLVGRKPWDAQRSHTLAYAVQPTCEAPGLRDPVFGGLSTPAKQLLTWMLVEDPSRRPTAQQVLGHSWVLQGGMCKVEGASSSVTAVAAGPSRVYQQVVQQRLQVLSHSRDIMGSARGLIVIHGRGSRSQAVMFHRAVKAARLQLQQQAAALQASGQVQSAAGAGTPEGTVQQPQAQTASAPALEGASSAIAQQGASSEASAVAGRGGNNAAAEAALARSSAPAASAAKSGTAAAADRGRAMPRPASAASLAAAAAQDSAAGEPAGMRSQKSVTVGQLARQDLTNRHSLLYGAVQQQQQSQPAQPLLHQQHGNRHSSMPGSTETSSKKGRHKHTASEGGAWFGSAALHGNPASSAVAAAGSTAAAAAAAAQPIAIDLKQLALVDNLERGMSAPNADVALFSPPAAGARAFVGPIRQERAVSMSPGALALLDADDQLCLLNAAGGMSVEDEDNTLLGGGVLSWGRKGAADMVASFRENYPMKPIVRSIARFGQSFSRSLSRTPWSLSGQSALSPSASGRYMDAAAAAAATEAHTVPTSAQGSVTEQTAGAAVDAAVAVAAAAAAEGATSSAETVPAAEPAAAAPSECGLDRISFMLPGGFAATSGEEAAVAAAVAAAVEEPSLPAAAVAVAAPVQADQAIIPLASAGSRLSSTRFSEEGSLDMQGAFLGGQMSLDSSMAHSFLAATLDARSPTSSLPRRSSLSPAAPAAAAARASRQPEWLPLRVPPGATAAELAELSVGTQKLGARDDTARVSAGSVSSSSARPSAFASTGGAAAAAAVLSDHRTSKGSPETAAAAPVRNRGNDSGPFGAGMQSPTVRAAATAAAARAEEEGIGLPNGLWLQQSMSVKSTTVTNILQLLSPTKGSQAAAEAAAGADAQQIGSAGGSLELETAGSSRTLSGGLNPLSPDEAGPLRSSSSTTAGARSSSETEADAGLADTAQTAAGTAAGDGSAGTEADRRLSPSSPVVHTRDISIIGWLPEVHAAEADTAAAAAATAAQVLVSDGSSSVQLAVSAAGDLTAAASSNPSTAAAAAKQAGSHSRAVSVPRSVAAAGSRRSRPMQLWLSPGQPGLHRHRHSSSDGGVLPQTGGMGPARMGSSGVGDVGDSILERASSAAASSADQEFYVGSFWSPTGLAGQPGSRRQQQQQRGVLARSTSSMGRLDSLQDSLAGDSATVAAELDFGAAGVLSPPEADALMLEASTAADASVSRTCSSVPGHRNSVGVSGGGYRGYQRNRVSVDGAQGMLEGCSPADCSGDTWGARGGGLQQDGASVLVRVHSGAMGDPTISATAAKAGSTGAGLSAVARAGGPFAAAADSTVAGEVRPAGNYTWIAKAVVSRSPEQPQPPKPQPQFDAFDEPHGEWYYAGTT